MDYNKIYNNLIQKRIDNPVGSDTYSEKHHIIPRCMGGDDSKDNLVQLTPEEHFLAHKLLCKIYPHIKGLRYALICLTWGDKRTNNKLVGHFRKLHAATVGEASRKRWLDDDYKNYMRECSKFERTDELKERIRNSLNEYYNSGRYDPTEISMKMKEKHKNGFFEDSYKKISNANKGKKKPDGFGEHLSKVRTGIVFTDEHKNNISKRRKEEKSFIGDDNPMTNPEYRKKVANSKIGRKRVYSKNGSFIYAKKEKLCDYRFENGKYYDY